MVQFLQRYKKVLVNLLKILILLLTVGYIFLELSRKDALKNIEYLLSRIKESGFNSILILVVCLMVLNVFLEVVKWKYVVNKIQSLNFKNAFASVLSGMSIGIFTPNNIGEYGGRILYLKEEHRVQGVILNFLSSISQMVITLFAGFLAFCFYLPVYVNHDPIVLYIVVYLVLLLIVLILYLFVNMSRLSLYLSSFRIMKKYDKVTNTFSYFHTRHLLTILFYSGLRYFVFSTQYVLLLQFFVPEIPISASYMMISLIFFVQSILPGFAITELGVRGTVALFFMGHITGNTIGVLGAAFSIWAINVILPSICGTYYVIKANFISADS